MGCAATRGAPTPHAVRWGRLSPCSADTREATLDRLFPPAARTFHACSNGLRQSSTFAPGLGLAIVGIAVAAYLGERRGHAGSRHRRRRRRVARRAAGRRRRDRRIGVRAAHPGDPGRGPRPATDAPRGHRRADGPRLRRAGEDRRRGGLAARRRRGPGARPSPTPSGGASEETARADEGGGARPTAWRPSWARSGGRLSRSRRTPRPPGTR